MLPRLIAGLPGLSSQAGKLALADWQKWFGPYQALRSVLEPPAGRRSSIAPAYGFALVMLLFSVLLNLWGIVALARLEPERRTDHAARTPGGRGHRPRQGPRRPGRGSRPVGPTRSYWRETATRAYGRRPLLVKAAYVLVLGLICYYALAPLWTTGGHPPVRVRGGLRAGAGRHSEPAAGQRPGGDRHHLRARRRRPGPVARDRPDAQGIHLRQAGRHLLQHQGVHPAAAPPGRRLRLLPIPPKPPDPRPCPPASACWPRRRRSTRICGRKPTSRPSSASSGPRWCSWPSPWCWGFTWRCARENSRAGRDPHAGHGLLPLGRHAGLHLPDPDQRPFRVPVDQLRLLHRGRASAACGGC